MALSSLEVVAGSGVVALLTMVGAFGHSGAPSPWTTQTLVGEPYRHRVLEAKVPTPAAVRLAVPFAWAVVGVCALRALVLVLQIMALDVTVLTAAIPDCATFPCEERIAPIQHSFDVLSAALYGAYLIATAAALGAFARWARDAARDMNQCRRSAPHVAGGTLVVVALAIPPLIGIREGQLAHGVVFHPGPDFSWLTSLIHVGVVFLGAVFIAVAQRSAASSGEG